MGKGNKIIKLSMVKTIFKGNISVPIFIKNGNLDGSHCL